MNHEKEYLKNLAADPDIKHFGDEELAEIEKLELFGGGLWCAVKCSIDLGICIAKGGSKAECGLKFTKCIIECKEKDKKE